MSTSVAIVVECEGEAADPEDWECEWGWHIGYAFRALDDIACSGEVTPISHFVENINEMSKLCPEEEALETETLSDGEWEALEARWSREHASVGPFFEPSEALPTIDLLIERLRSDSDCLDPYPVGGVVQAGAPGLTLTWRRQGILLDLGCIRAHLIQLESRSKRFRIEISP